MMTSRPTFRVFWVCAATLLAAMTWLTIHALLLEKREAYSQAAAARQEATRLALWRMDSAMTPVIAREAARPYFHYQSFYPTDRAFTNMLKEVTPGEVLVPSPLLDAPVGVIRLYFEVDSEGKVTSPQVPRTEQQHLAPPGTYSTMNFIAAQDQLSQFTSLLAPQTFAGIPPPAPRARPQVVEPEAARVYADGRDDVTNEFDRRQERLALASTPELAPENAVATRALRDKAPADARANLEKTESLDQSVELQAPPTDQVRNRSAAEPAPPASAAAGAPADSAGRQLGEDSARQSTKSPISMSDLAPSWVGPEENPQLVFTRRVSLSGNEYEQGFWMDWQLTRSWLLSGIGDLLPWAELQPVREDVRARPPEALGRTLASIPAELVVRQAVVAAPIGWTTLRGGLLLSWLAVLAALVVTWRVLKALHELAERRGRFAAAVTHELRTPITTFRMYSQMLAEDMVPADRRAEYLATMSREAQRLSQIVESVLEYARLGRRDPARSIQQLELRSILDPLAAKLAEHAAERGFELRTDLGASAGVIVKADPTGVERVLLNLVDNACKYARGHAPQVISLSVRLARGHAVITVADNGPGLTVEESRRVFEPYFRGPRTTELGVPGLGLGLALARGAARGMDGDLKLVQPEGGKGTVFALLLELA